MAAIKEYAEGICRAVAGRVLPEFPEEVDPIAYETNTWEQSLGSLKSPIAKSLGVPDFNRQEHIGQASSVLQSMGL